MAKRISILNSFDKGIKLLLMLWSIQIIQILLPFTNLQKYGILPREYSGLPGIFLYNFIHGDFIHLISNSLPLLIFIWMLYQHFRPLAGKVIFRGMFLTGFLVWCFARKNYHIGASGLVYTLAGFIIGSGFYRKENKTFFLSLLIISTYGTTMFFGILPLNRWVSWEAHFFGALTGFYLSKKYKDIKIIS